MGHQLSIQPPDTQDKKEPVSLSEADKVKELDKHMYSSDI